MSLLSLQVAALTATYRPPQPVGGTVHRCYDDPDPVENEAIKVCNRCKAAKPIGEFRLAVGRNYPCTICRACESAASTQRKIAKRLARAPAPSRQKSAETRLAILKALSAGVMTAKNVADKTGIDSEICRKYMDRMAEEGLMTKGGSRGNITYRVRK